MKRYYITRTELFTKQKDYYVGRNSRFVPIWSKDEDDMDIWFFSDKQLSMDYLLHRILYVDLSSVQLYKTSVDNNTILEFSYNEYTYRVEEIGVESGIVEDLKKLIDKINPDHHIPARGGVMMELIRLVKSL